MLPNGCQGPVCPQPLILLPSVHHAAHRERDREAIGQNTALGLLSWVTSLHRFSVKAQLAAEPEELDGFWAATEAGINVTGCPILSPPSVGGQRDAAAAPATGMRDGRPYLVQSSFKGLDRAISWHTKIKRQKTIALRSRDVNANECQQSVAMLSSFPVLQTQLLLSKCFS